jgi:hypothetical protein
MNANPLPTLIEEDVQKEAYLLYLASGCVPGHDLENWLVARERLASRQILVQKKTEFSPLAGLHFPLNANVSRAPFESLHPFASHN